MSRPLRVECRLRNFHSMARCLLTPTPVLFSTRPGVPSAGRARMLNVSPYSLERAGRGRVGFFLHD